ncbi:acetyl-coenzyme A synthetase [Candidatus Gracilibacteria bacterium]|nr:MAG: acetyl-coenzyme A synthetase [Candidatus Gracilibacteria bacterium]
MYDTKNPKSKENPENFFGDLAKENLTFFEDFTSVLDESDYPKVKWFSGGKINICYEAVDKNLKENGDKIALIFEAENGENEKVTYKELSKKVNKSANLLKSLGIKKGDTIIFYMPQILESVYLMLACLRIGAIHSIVFGGFSSESIKDRIDDLKPKLIITADGAYRKGKAYFLKEKVDEALEKSEHKVDKVLVVERLRNPTQCHPELGSGSLHINETPYKEIPDRSPGGQNGGKKEDSGINSKGQNRGQIKEIYYNKEIESQSEECDFELMDSEDISFVLYTSGSTGKPKGIVHTTAGYALWTKITSKWVFDMQENDVFFSSADIGWITGHSYTVYGPLLNGITTLLYEGNPLYPDDGRIWEIIEKHKVNTFYTAPTLIRMLHKTGAELPKKYNLRSLKILGTVGEPIDFDAWNWFYNVVGNKKCSLVDTYWQTETGGHILAPLPFATPLKQRSATFPLPGIAGEIVDEDGNPSKKGFFVISKPWPSMARGIWGDEKRFKETYFSEIFREKKTLYFSGDGGYYDEDNYIFITGRVDDIVNISGHRIGIAEVESAISELPEIAECSVVGVPDEITGESLFAYVVLKNKNCHSEFSSESFSKKNVNQVKDPETIPNQVEDDIPGGHLEELQEKIKLKLRENIGAFAYVKNLVVVPGLPKTRSGKIMRRILRSLAKKEEITSDISTLENREVIEEIRKKRGE